MRPGVSATCKIFFISEWLVLSVVDVNRSYYLLIRVIANSLAAYMALPNSIPQCSLDQLILADAMTFPVQMKVKVYATDSVTVMLARITKNAATQISVESYPSDLYF